MNTRKPVSVGHGIPFSLLTVSESHPSYSPSSAYGTHTIPPHTRLSESCLVLHRHCIFELLATTNRTLGEAWDE